MGVPGYKTITGTAPAMNISYIAPKVFEFHIHFKPLIVLEHIQLLITYFRVKSSNFWGDYPSVFASMIRE